MEKEIKAWILDINQLKIESIKNFVENNIANKVTTTQLRRFYGSVKAIDMKYRLKPTDFRKIEIILLLPALAYAIGRQQKGPSKDALEKLFKVLESGITSIEKVEHFNNFVSIFEAIVAYNKFFETTK